jgi:hypothetical protein
MSPPPLGYLLKSSASLSDKSGRVGVSLAFGPFGNLALGILFFASLSFVHLLLGASPLVILAAFGGATIAIVAVIRNPLELGSWFTALTFVQMYGFAWVYKTILLVPLDQGLPAAETSMFWGLLIVIAAAIAHAVSRRVQRTSLLGYYYDTATNWEACGTILYCLGQVALIVDRLVNGGEEFTTGALSPISFHVYSGIFLISAAAAKSNRVFSPKLIAIFFIAFFETFLFNEKTQLVFCLAAIAVPLLTGAVDLAKKLVLVSVGFAVILIANTVVFPAVHAMRDVDFKSKDLSTRLSMISSAIAMPNAFAEDARKRGDIWFENTDFVPTDGYFLTRFGSLDYLAITLKYGDPGMYQMSPLAFVTECIRRALPGSMLGEKDLHQLSDHLWYQMDRRMRFISNTTMGPFGSARLIFGDVSGYLIVTFEWCVVLTIGAFLFGTDIRKPIPQFFLVISLFLMLDADVANTAVTAMRLIWQDAAIIGIAGYLATMWKQQSTLIFAIRKN